jgi:hypothetical protein
VHNFLLQLNVVLSWNRGTSVGRPAIWASDLKQFATHTWFMSCRLKTFSPTRFISNVLTEIPSWREHIFRNITRALMKSFTATWSQYTTSHFSMTFRVEQRNLVEERQEQGYWQQYHLKNHENIMYVRACVIGGCSASIPWNHRHGRKSLRY